MPELPEVEAIRRVIEPQIKGLTIEKVRINRAETIAYPDADTFASSLTGQTIADMSRRGKFLTVNLTSHDRMILHLRMTGCLLVTAPEYPEEKHTHLVFDLNNGNELRFSDTRRFGRFWFLRNGEEDTYSGIDKLGIEPLDERLNAGYLSSHLGKRKKAIKGCLLDQDLIAGLGNIYTDEILFSAGIHPSRPANTLNMSEWERLATTIPERISFFIEKNLMTPEEYLESKGKDYRNTPYLQVYGKKGEVCPKCGDTLMPIKVSGRGSVYCPSCQEEPK